MESLIRPEVRALSAYHVADAVGYVKLDAMENPYTWPEAMTAEWLERLRSLPLNRYPDPSPAGLKTLLRDSNGVPPGMDLLLGNGSDEIIQMLLMAVAGPGVKVLAPEPTFVMYRQIASTLGLEFVGVPLAADFSMDMPAMAAAIAEHKPALVFLAYPNNPTGNLFERADVEAIVALTPGLVVVDEAYAPFAEASFMEDLPRHGNLLVMRTLSKLGLAGLRLGFLAGPPSWLHELDKVRMPYNINVLTQATVEFALERLPVFEEQTALLRQERAALFQALQSMPGITPFPSRANFILFRCEGVAAGDVFDGIKRGGVLIKNSSSAGGALSGCLRVTVGKPEENRRFISALEQAISGR
ncbi:histidinol-phosphate transaminase [Methylogaea oryzae]|uniref:histidinol-phosphate transaminase n=1 Tax=Methylogaea oryzae TaxID=1295382 RepID=UPI0006D0EB13|nr:histidinol-phosphate transaminase [Methylogaea oryzae]